MLKTFYFKISILCNKNLYKQNFRRILNCILIYVLNNVFIFLGKFIYICGKRCKSLFVLVTTMHSKTKSYVVT